MPSKLSDDEKKAVADFFFSIGKLIAVSTFVINDDAIRQAAENCAESVANFSAVALGAK